MNEDHIIEGDQIDRLLLIFLIFHHDFVHHVIVELLVVKVDLAVVLDDLAEGEVQLLDSVEGEEPAHYQVIHVMIVQHVDVVSEDGLQGFEDVVDDVVFQTEGATQLIDLQGSLHQQLPEETITETVRMIFLALCDADHPLKVLPFSPQFLSQVACFKVNQVHLHRTRHGSIEIGKEIASLPHLEGRHSYLLLNVLKSQGGVIDKQHDLDTDRHESKINPLILLLFRMLPQKLLQGQLEQRINQMLSDLFGLLITTLLLDVDEHLDMFVHVLLERTLFLFVLREDLLYLPGFLMHVVVHLHASSYRGLADKVDSHC